MQLEEEKQRVLKIEVRQNGNSYDVRANDTEENQEATVEEVPETLEKLLLLTSDERFAATFHKVIFEFFKHGSEDAQGGEVLVHGRSQVEWATFIVPSTQPNQRFQSMEISMDMQVNLDEVYSTLVESALTLNPGATKVLLEFVTSDSFKPAA